MSEIRTATVRERVMATLRDCLKDIQQANGFNNNVRDVWITRNVPQQPADPNILKVAVLTSERLTNCNARYYEVVKLEIHFFDQRMQDPDRTFNLWVGDIQESLKNTLLDKTHPNPQNTGIFFEEVRVVPNYNLPTQGGSSGFIEYEMTFWYSQNDNRLWDDYEDSHVDIEYA